MITPAVIAVAAGKALLPVALKLAADFAPHLIGMLTRSEKAEEIAEKVVEIARGVTGAATPEEAVDRIQRDESMRLEFQRLAVDKELELARIDAETARLMYGLEMAQVQAGTQKYEADVRDRGSARDMQVATRARTPAVLAVVITVGFFVVLVLMMTGVFKATDNQSLLILLGALSAGFGQVLNFFFGSSASSQQKDGVIGSIVSRSKEGR